MFTYISLDYENDGNLCGGKCEWDTNDNSVYECMVKNQGKPLNLL